MDLCVDFRAQTEIHVVVLRATYLSMPWVYRATRKPMLLILRSTRKLMP